MNGFASNIVVTLHKDGSSITVAGDGPRHPGGQHPATKKSALEGDSLTVLHAGGKFEKGNYKTAGGSHGRRCERRHAPLDRARGDRSSVTGAQWE
jgi:DNA gyrase subunit B/topoisomerase-4 subunit B